MDHPARWRGQGTLYSLILKQTYGLQALVLLLGLGLPVLAVLPLHLQQQIVDEAIPAQDLSLLGWLAGLYIAATLLRGALKFAIIYLRGWIAEIVNRMLRVTQIERQRHRAPAKAAQSLGTLTSVLTAEVEPLGNFAAEAINTPLIQGGTLLGVIGFMLYTEPLLAAIGIAALAVEGVLTPIIQTQINILTRRRIKTLRHAGAELIAATQPHCRRLMIETLHDVRETYRLRLRMNVLKGLLKVGRNLIDHSADIAVIAAGAVMVVDGRIELGVIVAFLSGMREVRGPWGEIISFYRRLADAWIKYLLVQQALNGGAVILTDTRPAPAMAETVLPRRRQEE